jgi:alkanesulfonate monooxygenase SsuD/methylene tetrahydromethanopterin reductase-like flavin-dependent oxidoreductase (luciferase family)
VKVKFGVFLPFYAFRSQTSAVSMFSRLRAIVLECERLGYDSVWLDDHLMFKKLPIFECWTSLSALASTTSKIRLGTMVTSNAFRNPALVAKMAATVDVVSGGRLEFGVGAGVQRDEHIAYGYEFPEPIARVERLKESLEIIKMLWTQEESTYTGKYYRVNTAVCEPKPVQKPYPPITVGGCGEKHLLKVTALQADRFDFSYLPSLALYKHKLELLQEHCRLVGRNFEEIEKSSWPEAQIILGEDKKALDEKVEQIKPSGVSRKDFERSHFLGTPDEFVARLEPYLGLGVNRFMLFFADLPDKDSLRLFAKHVSKL